MPSIMTLEGPKSGNVSGTSKLVSVVQAATMSPGRMALWLVGGAALIGVSWIFVRHERRGLRGLGIDLKTIAREARDAEDYARRAEAWNHGNAPKLKLSVDKLAKGYPGASPSTMKRLIRDAREAREAGWERLVTRNAAGLRGDPPKLRVGQRLDYIGQTFVVTSITRGKKPVVYIARPSKDSFGREHLIDARSFPLHEFDRQHLKPLDGRRARLGSVDVTDKQQRMFKRGVGAMRRAMRGARGDAETAFGVAIRGSKDPDFAVGVRTAWNLVSSKGNRDAAQTNLVKYGFKAP